MNLLGSPNWISGVALCAGNTAAINWMVYGWFPQPDYSATQCIVLFGHNPKKHSWTPVYNKIRRAQERGAKLIVLDPRRSENAELADLWLPLRPRAAGHSARLRDDRDSNDQGSRRPRRPNLARPGDLGDRNPAFRCPERSASASRMHSGNDDGPSHQAIASGA
jgi:hypothetical protein